MIELKNWRVLMEVRDRELGYESDHLHRRLEIAVDLDAGWAVKLDMALGKAKNVVDLERTGDVLWVDLTRDILASDGLYRCQLRGLKGDTVAHSNQFELLVSGSINAAEAFPSVEPSELAQMEARVTQAKADAVAAAGRAEAAAEILPSVKVARTESGALLTAVDASGTTTAEVMDGVQGPAGIGVPAGGKSGQLLTRTEDGTAWQDAPESAVQPDWAQNDPTAKDYIKNRTHYETEESICDVDLTWPGGHISGNVPYTTAPVAGETYKVVIDGSAYTAAATQYSDTVIEIKPSISIRWDTAAQTVYGYNQGGYYGTRHVAVYRSVPHPLDPKYLPEYVITITQTANSESNITVTCDRTFAEILSASNSGMLLKVVVKLDAPSLSISGKIVTRHIEYVDDGESEQFAVYSPYLNLGYLITAEGISIGK
ncbi:hypothetical protein [Intestinimonas butyriciproducens]|uniref:hypothetical protein n=1 Tax=Intestinimonas butyriciproducens TaxID=1297617 RepID=UPI001897AA9E|nr:hypothetical protein [Intestinimonas butyriciproducens]MDB7829092.1 hypothetical protein [Intestinimonas butyriciproducens]